MSDATAPVRIYLSGNKLTIAGTVLSVLLILLALIAPQLLVFMTLRLLHSDFDRCSGIARP